MSKQDDDQLFADSTVAKKKGGSKPVSAAKAAPAKDVKDAKSTPVPDAKVAKPAPAPVQASSHPVSATVAAQGDAECKAQSRSGVGCQARIQRQRPLCGPTAPVLSHSSSSASALPACMYVLCA